MHSSGGEGFIGSYLVERLIKEDHKVVVMDNLSTSKKENLNPEVKFYKADICDTKISQIFKEEKPEVVFHLAAQIDVRKSVENPIENARINILGTLNLLENCKKYKVKSFIFVSTGGAIYCDDKVIPKSESYHEFPLSPYEIEKLTIDKYIIYYYKILGLPFVSSRLANVYGSRQNSKGESGVIAIFCDKILNGKQPVINGSGTQTRDFIFVEDIVEAALLTMKIKKSGIYNIGTAKETDINTIFKKLKKLTGSKCKRIHVPALPGEQKRCHDYSKARTELGWQPKYTLDKGLNKTVEKFRNESGF